MFCFTICKEKKMVCSGCSVLIKPGTKCCDQCGTPLVSDALLASIVGKTSSEASEFTAHERGNTVLQGSSGRKKLFSWLVLFLLVALLFVLWLGFSDGTRREAAHNVAPEAVLVETGDVLKAPTLAEQMGNVTPSSSPKMEVTESDQSQDGTSVQAGSFPVVQPRQVENSSSYTVPTMSRTGEGRESMEVYSSSQAGASAEAEAGMTTAPQVAACNKKSIFAKQSCLWSVCNHRWGQNGCPAYD